MIRKPPYPICPLCGHPVVGALLTSDSVTGYDKYTQEVERYYHPRAISVYCSNGDCNYDRLLTELPFPPTVKESPRATHDLLELAGVVVPLDVIKGWDGETILRVEEWAACVYADASDNDVLRPPLPEVLQPYTKKVLHCSVCGEEQFDTPGGLCCKNHHGGAPSKEES